MFLQVLGRHREILAPYDPGTLVQSASFIVSLRLDWYALHECLQMHPKCSLFPYMYFWSDNR